MSWQTYIDDHLMVDLPNGGKLTSAAIFGQDGGVWAQSPNFPALSADQVKVLMTGYLDPVRVTGASGVRFRRASPHRTDPSRSSASRRVE